MTLEAAEPRSRDGDAATSASSTGATSAGVGFRYGGVLALTLAVVVVLIASPAGEWSRAFALALEFLALVVVIATSRERERVRRHRAVILSAAAGIVVLLVGLGFMPVAVTFSIAALLSILIPASLIGGLIRLTRRSGVTLRVVAGALAIYLLVGLMFAFVISIVAQVGTGPYFSNGSAGSLSDHVYFSFTTMTTTGYGDFAAGHPFGRAIAVVEMLTGQLYLVTVIGVLVGDIAGRRRG